MTKNLTKGNAILKPLPSNKNKKTSLIVNNWKLNKFLFNWDRNLEFCGQCW